jgi:D-alanyl-lipoteichoic acid acyltransferase DltB (MBOAT superfamily)
LCLATFFFAYQIYCDFSGYSDIAIGSARVLGFRLMENFNSPYHSLSVSEFWRRWHISLSTWFKDYVYFPLGGNRAGTARWALNIFVTFGISGLWHGASWTFVFWGLLNGLYLVVGNLTKPFRDRVMASVGLPGTSLSRKCIMWASTFLLTCFAWIFFRAESFGDAWYILNHLFVGWDLGRISTPNLLLRQLPIAIGSILFLEFVQLYGHRFLRSHFLLRIPTLPRWSFYSVATVLVILFGVYREGQFIYFQF